MDTKTLCLAVLSRSDASGYEIKKAFEDGPFAHITEVGFGSIYPALAALLGDGLVSVAKFEQEGRPDKKVYSLTSSGRMALLDALNEPTEPDKVRCDFLFRMMFSSLLTPSILEEMMDSRIDQLNATIARIEQGLEEEPGDAGDAFVRGFGLAMYKTMATYIEEHKYALLGASLLPDRAVAE